MISRRLCGLGIDISMSRFKLHFQQLAIQNHGSGGIVN